MVGQTTAGNNGERMILEPAVSITDYAIAVESGILATLTWRKPRHACRVWFEVFFASVGLAAALGGTVHGFVADQRTVANAVMWRATLIAIGVVALAAAMAGAGSGWGRIVRRSVAGIGVTGFAIYCVAVVFFTQEYLVAIVVYLPATMFLLISFVAACVRARTAWQQRIRLLSGAAGMLLTFIAAGVQQSDLEIRALYLDHNAIYHVIQAGALLLIYAGTAGVVRQSGPARDFGRENDNPIGGNRRLS